MMQHKIVSTGYGNVECLIFNQHSQHIPLVFFHGTPGDCHQVRFYLNHLIEAGYPIISMSRPGYGKTEVEKKYSTFLIQSDITRSIICSLNIDKIILYAVSGGAAIAYKFIEEYPNACKGAILESPVVGKWIPRKHNTIDKLMNWAYINNFVYKISNYVFLYNPRLIVALTLYHFSEYSFFRCWKNAKHILNNVKLTMQFNFLISSMYPSHVKEGFLNDIVQLKKGNNYIHKNQHVPVLVFHGNKDKEIPVRQVKSHFSKYENILFVEVNEGHHLLPLMDEYNVIKHQQNFLSHLNVK